MLVANENSFPITTFSMDSDKKQPFSSMPLLIELAKLV